MKLHSTLLVFIALAIPPFCAAAEWEWCSLLQVKRIALAAQLADYPFPQRRLERVIGARKLPHLGGSNDERGRAYGIVALTDPDSPSGYYAVRIFYILTDPLPKPDEIPIGELQVLFLPKGRLSFVYEMNRALKHMLPDLKKKMQKDGVTPIAFSDSFFSLSLFAGEKPPNQALEPTSTAVTPPADAGDRASGTRGSP